MTARPHQPNRLGEGGLDGRNQICKALANARARLHHQVPALGDGPGHGVGHRKLLRPGFIVSQPLGDRSAGAEDGAMRHQLILPARNTAEPAARV